MLPSKLIDEEAAVKVIFFTEIAVNTKFTVKDKSLPSVVETVTLPSAPFLSAVHETMPFSILIFELFDSNNKFGLVALLGATVIVSPKLNYIIAHKISKQKKVKYLKLLLT